MKKSIGLFVGVVALLVVAVPAMAFYRPPTPQMPEIKNTNTVYVHEEVRANANTGYNMVGVSGQTRPSRCFNTYNKGLGAVKTGDAYAMADGLVAVNVQEDCTNCGIKGEVTNLNKVGVTNLVSSNANTGYNAVKVSRGTGRIVTGDATSVSNGAVLVNIQVPAMY